MNVNRITDEKTRMILLELHQLNRVMVGTEDHYNSLSQEELDQGLRGTTLLKAREKARDAFKECSAKLAKHMLTLFAFPIESAELEYADSFVCSAHPSGEHAWVANWGKESVYRCYHCGKVKPKI